MTYDAKKKAVVIPVADLDRVEGNIIYALRHIRQVSGRPLTPHKRPAQMDDYDHINAAIMNIAKSIGLEMGAEWAEELDVTQK